MVQLFLSFLVGMDWLVILLLSLGVVLLVIEYFVPGFGVFGITGFVSVISGMLIRVVGKGLSISTAFLYVGFMVLIVAVVFLILAMIGKSCITSRSSIFLKSTAVPVGKTAATPDYSKIDGKRGVALTDLNPSGKIMIDGEIYDVVALGEYIYANSPVIVLNVKGAIIYVSKHTA